MTFRGPFVHERLQDVSNHFRTLSIAKQAFSSSLAEVFAAQKGVQGDVDASEDGGA